MAECVDLLLCAEDAGNVFGFCKEDVEEEQKCLSNVIRDFPLLGDDEFQTLLEKEIQCIPGKSYVQCYRNQSLDIDSRFKAISWILKVHGVYRFGALTAYRSVNYLDRFLQRRPPQKGRAWMMQLLAVGCLSLAAKMEETEVPFLAELQVEDPDFMFESRTVQRMELLILSTLQWRMLSVTPFSFLDFFLDRCNGNGNGIVDASTLVSVSCRAHDLILSANRAIEFTEQRPSAIAAAAVICAAEEILTADAMAMWKGSLLSCKLMHREWIVSSYNMMKEILELERACIVKSIWSSVPQSPVAVLDAFCLSSSTTTCTTSTSNSVTVTPSSLRSLYASVASKRRKLDCTTTNAC